MHEDPLSLLIQVADTVARQRVMLEQAEFGTLSDILEEVGRAVSALNSFPGGVESLRASAETLPEAEREQFRALLEQAANDHRISGDLIELMTQRMAALQATFATQSDTATYSGAGIIGQDAGSLLSRRA
jgi:hypothetical protein